MNTKEIAAKLNWAMQAVPLAKEQKDVLTCKSNSKIYNK